MSNAKELNQLLSEAKAKYRAWKDFQAVGEWNREGWKEFYRSNNAAWENFEKELSRAIPIQFVAADGSIKTIGTLGRATSDLMLYYSAEPSAEYLMDGYSLPSIQYFL